MTTSETSETILFIGPGPGGNEIKIAMEATTIDQQAMGASLADAKIMVRDGDEWREDTQAIAPPGTTVESAIKWLIYRVFEAGALAGRRRFIDEVKGAETVAMSAEMLEHIDRALALVPDSWAGPIWDVRAWVRDMVFGLGGKVERIREDHDTPPNQATIRIVLAASDLQDLINGAENVEGLKDLVRRHVSPAATAAALSVLREGVVAGLITCPSHLAINPAAANSPDPERETDAPRGTTDERDGEADPVEPVAE